jgi:WD40 repeat protein/Ca2+-binding EF-hand superfamily protein
VIYDYSTKTQKLLQGHCNPITSTCVSADKKWLATADSGPDSVIVIWDSDTGVPVKTIFNPHAGGVCALAMSSDAMFVASLSSVDPTLASEQELSLWEWTTDNEGALYTSTVPHVVGSSNAHTSVNFNPVDPREIVTNGPRNVTFWTWETFLLKSYDPVMSKKEAGALAHISFITTIYLPETKTCVTSTSAGELVLWDAVVREESAANQDELNVASDEPVETFPRKSIVKTIHLCEGRIDWLSTVDTAYLVVAGEDGAVRFYDFGLRIVAWFEDLNAGPVTSISFASSSAGWQQQNTLDEEDGAFLCPDFIVGTATSYIIGVECGLFTEIEPENRRGAVLVQGLGDDVPCLACHPTMDRLLVGVYDGTLQLWDFRSKTLLMVQELKQDVANNMGGNVQSVTVRPQTMCFDGAGNALAIGMTSGMVRISDAESLQEIESFTNSDSPITFLKFSNDSTWLAAADAQHYVSIYNFVLSADDQRQRQPEDDDNESSTTNENQMVPKWIYVGRYKSHTKAITGLEFTTREDGRTALVSIGEDRMLVEYDLTDATPETGVLLRSDPTKIEQTAVPTACMWHPLLGGDFEDRIVTANNEFKFKQWNADNKSCRRTNLCPTYGGPLNALIAIPAIDPETNKYGPSKYVVYSTAEKVVGIIKLPLDGNPDKAMGLIGHPTSISSIAVSGDGRVVFTAGGSDRCVNIWNVDVAALDRKEEEALSSVVERGGSASMFDELIDAETRQDIVDYFYYAQLRTQGEDATEERQITGKVPLEEIPNMVRALGFYPTEEEVANMVAEIKYATFTETGETQETIDLDTFIKLFVNHKPVFGTSKTEIEEAFNVLGGKMNWGQMVKLLQERGEAMDVGDLKNILKALMGPEGEEVLADSRKGLSAEQFSDKVLGFTEVEEDLGFEDFEEGV